MVLGWIKKIGEDTPEKLARRLTPIVEAVAGHEPAMQALSDDDLRGKTPEFRRRLEGGEALEDLLPEAIAAGCIVLAAMVDPLLGELKPRDRSMAMLVGVVAATFILALFEIQWYYAIIAAAAAVWAEQFNLRQLDDDMLMQFAPALVLILFWLLGDIGLLPDLGGISFDNFGGD